MYASGRIRPGLGLDCPRQNAELGYQPGTTLPHSAGYRETYFHSTPGSGLATDNQEPGGGGDALPTSHQKHAGEPHQNHPTGSDAALITNPKTPSAY